MLNVIGFILLIIFGLAAGIVLLPLIAYFFILVAGFLIYTIAFIVYFIIVIFAAIIATIVSLLP